MTDHVSEQATGMGAVRRAAIEAEVRQAARDHLRSKTAAEALSYYTPDAIVASDGSLYPSFDHFSEDARAFYAMLQRVDLAEWDEMQVRVIGEEAAVLTATFRWSSTDTAGERFDAKGVWTAVFVKHAEGWKIVARHESFERREEPGRPG